MISRVLVSSGHMLNWFSFLAKKQAYTVSSSDEIGPKKENRMSGIYENITYYVWILCSTMFCKKRQKSRIPLFRRIHLNQQKTALCANINDLGVILDDFSANFPIQWNVAFPVRTRSYIIFCDEIRCFVFMYLRNTLLNIFISCG